MFALCYVLHQERLSESAKCNITSYSPAKRKGNFDSNYDIIWVRIFGTKSRFDDLVAVKSRFEILLSRIICFCFNEEVHNYLVSKPTHALKCLFKVQFGMTCVHLSGNVHGLPCLWYNSEWLVFISLEIFFIHVLSLKRNWVFEYEPYNNYEISIHASRFFNCSSNIQSWKQQCCKLKGVVEYIVIIIL